MEEFDNLSQCDIENEEDILDLFIDFFRFIKGYSDWNDEEIMGSVNNDDIKDYLKYMQDTLQERIGIEKKNLLKEDK